MLWGKLHLISSQCVHERVELLGRQGSFQSIPQFQRISEDIHNPVWNGSKITILHHFLSTGILSKKIPKLFFVPQNLGMICISLKKKREENNQPFPTRSTTPPASTTRGTSRTPPTPRTPRTPPPAEKPKAAGWWRFWMNFVSRKLTKRTQLWKYCKWWYIYIY